MNFPEEITSKNGAIIIKMDRLLELHILPTGKVVLSMLGIKDGYKIYNKMEDYPDNASYVGGINTETYEPDGCGMFNYKNDKDSDYETYVGGVSNGLWHGNGTLTYKNGTIEQGIFDNEIFRGKQTLALIDKEVYDCDCDCLYCKEMPRTFTLAEDKHPINLCPNCQKY